MTPAQLQTLGAYIAADPVLSLIPNSNDGAYEVAAALNLPASPAYSVWQTSVPTQDILDAIDWAKYTPSDAPDGSGTWTNRMLAIQTKQMNLQNMLVGRESINATRANLRDGLRDAVIQLPAGVAGSMVAAGGASGVNVLNKMVRPARLIEKILVTGTATTGSVTAGLMGYEGTVSPGDVSTARGG